MSAQQFYFNPAHVFDSKNPDFTTWYNRVNVELAAFGCLGVALGQETRPLEASEQREFDMRAATAKKIIMNTVDATIARMGNGDTSAADILQYMRKMYEKRHQHSIFDAREQFIKLKYKDGMDMAFHVSQVQVLADELVRAGRKIDDVEKAYQLLSSLPESWKQVRDRCLDADVVDWEVVQAKVLSAYRSRSAVKSGDSEPNGRRVITDSALVLHGGNSKRRHVQAFGSKPQGRKNSKWAKGQRQQHGDTQSCQYCSKPNHSEANCRLKKRHDGERNRGPRFHAAMAVVTAPPAPSVDLPAKPEEWMLAAVGEKRHLDESSGSDGSGLEWIVDSGCTSHICKDAKLFVKLDAKDGTVVAANAASLAVRGVGTVVVSARSTDGQVVRLSLSNCLYVPTVAKNLLSVRKLHDSGASVDFNSFRGRVAISFKNSTIVSEANENSALYIMRLFDQSPCTSGHETHLVTATPTIGLWHQRLGVDAIKQLAGDGVVQRPGLRIVDKQ